MNELDGDIDVNNNCNQTPEQEKNRFLFEMGNGMGNRKRVSLTKKFPFPVSRFLFFKKTRFPFQTRFCDWKKHISRLNINFI